MVRRVFQGFFILGCALGAWLVSAETAAAYTHKLTSTGQPVRWAESVDRVVLRIDPAVERMLPPGQAFAAVAIAIDAWRFQGVPDVVIGEGAPPPYDEGARGNGIYVLSDWPFDAKRLAVTVTSYMPSGELLGADVLVNGNIDYALLSEGRLTSTMLGRHDLAAVLTHEMGHVLGLDESEAHEEATMWPFIRAGETHQRSLATDDEEGIVELYRIGLASPQVGCTLSAVARHRGTAPPGSWLIVLAGSALWVRSRRRPQRA